MKDQRRNLITSRYVNSGLIISEMRCASQALLTIILNGQRTSILELLEMQATLEQGWWSREGKELFQTGLDLIPLRCCDQGDGGMLTCACHYSVITPWPCRLGAPSWPWTVTQQCWPCNQECGDTPSWCFKFFLEVKVFSLSIHLFKESSSDFTIKVNLVARLCPTLCNPMDYSPPGSSIHEILQARILECIAIPFSRGSSPSRNQTRVSYIAGRFFTI